MFKYVCFLRAFNVYRTGLSYRKRDIRSMGVVFCAHNFLRDEEFSPGPFHQRNFLSIQDLQGTKKKHYRRSVEIAAGHLRGKQTVWLNIVID